MTCKTSYELHHNFPKLAHEAGFTFNTHKPRVKIDWNKIKTIDLKSVVKDRQFYIIEQHINDILDCVLESEFDMRILDEGVLKMFRIAQLAVEYHEFCRHYLDRSVFILRGEIASLIQELNHAKKQIQEKDGEIKKIKKRSKNSLKTTGPMYQNDSIAALILRNLTQTGDLFHHTAAATEPMNYNKCLHCEKVFVNNIYLQSHMTRRHPELVEAPQKDCGPEIINDLENPKLVEEIRDLKSKLKLMEELLVQNSTNNDSKGDITGHIMTSSNFLAPEPKKITKEMKDAEVPVQPFDEVGLLEKLDLWKTIEQQRHDQEVNYLKTQILETIKSLKDIETTNNNGDDDKRLIHHLKETIKLQSEEINSLRRELIDTVQRQQADYEPDSRKKLEEQMAYWISKAESQSQQYDMLVQKLNEVAQSANASRALAELEQSRADHLQALLEQSLHHQHDLNKTSKSESKVLNPTNMVAQYTNHSRSSLGELQQKAHTLMEISSSSSISEAETTKKNIGTSNIKLQKPKVGMVRAKNHKGPITTMKTLKKTNSKKAHSFTKPLPRTQMNRKKSKTGKKNEKVSTPKENGKVYTIYPAMTTPVSPSKVVRAKITEEVNNRLSTLGVDPLKNRLPHILYQRQRIQIQHLNDKKIKDNPYREKIRSAILEHLSFKTTELTNKVSSAPEYTSPSSTSAKPFNLYTVLSNVKTKALSLVKLHDNVRETNQKKLNADVTKRALMFLKTPPDSPAHSPNRKKKMSLSEPALRDKAKISVDSSKNNVNSSSSPESSAESNSEEYNQKYTLKPTKQSSHETAQVHSGSDSEEGNVTTGSPGTQKINSLETLIKSPARRPSSASILKQKNTVRDVTSKRSQSVINLLSDDKLHEKNETEKSNKQEAIETESPEKKDAIHGRVTKSVLKNALSMSSLNKKKVLFDMDAIQMKSVSASPDTTPCQENNDDGKLALGLIHVDGEEWDISSIESEDQLRNLTKHTPALNASDKSVVRELKNAIEMQIARRQNSTPVAPVGGVDVLKGPQLVKPTNMSGSNTSLGSSILDESEANQKVLYRPRRLAEKDESEIDISEISMDGRGSKNDL